MRTNISVLDCTLRDGGYCNSWRFGFSNIKKIVDGLGESNVEIIETGFLTNKGEYDRDVTKFPTSTLLGNLIYKKKEDVLYVMMMNYGEYVVENLPKCCSETVDGLRIAFHKNDRFEALKQCKVIKEKGYKVFIQAMVTMAYTDDEILEMVRIANDINPYAFYIVDSFGEMKRSELIRYLYLIDHNLDSKIKIGFHSHNNMQLAYSNALSLIEANLSRSLIIDSSIYGMGRGAGNLNTELFVQHLNETIDKEYNIDPLLNIIDEILIGFYEKNPWGYSLPNYISASHHAHPNYASYLDDKKTLTYKEMNTIFDKILPDKRATYDEEYVEKLYLSYMEVDRIHDEHRNELIKQIENRTILIVGAGKNSFLESEKITRFVSEKNPIVVSVNYEYTLCDTDFIFVSNARRYRDISKDLRNKCIVTSNIPADGVYIQTNYMDLISTKVAVKDNAGIMAIKFFLKLGADDVVLAGFDGYAYEADENFLSKDMSVEMKYSVIDSINDSMTTVLRELSHEVCLSFLTKPRYIMN